MRRAGLWRAGLCAALLAAVPAVAQHHGHGGHAMPGMTMPAPAAAAAAAADHTGPSASGTDLPAGRQGPPPPPADHYADRDHDPARMARARTRMMREDGGRTFHQILFNLAEVQVRAGARDGWRWDGQAWFGGDVDRLTLRTEGRGDARGGVDDAEVQALWSHALDAYFNVQAGVRQDFRPGPRRTFASLGIEGLAPLWFQVEARLFVSHRGEVSGRLEGWTDQRLTQRLVLQPRIELNLSAQDVPARTLGAGLSDAELGLRLRYEIVREFAPYVGLSYDARTGASARLARLAGERPRTVSLVAGTRFWF